MKPSHGRPEGNFSERLGEKIRKLCGGWAEADVAELDGTEYEAQGDADVAHAAGDDAAA